MSSRRTIVIKIGTNILTTIEGKLDLNSLRNLCHQISDVIEEKKYHFVVVTSGSITSGCEKMNIKPLNIPEKQAAAAVGQILLMQEYSNFFEQRGFQVAQVLLTQEAFEDARHKHAFNTIKTLISNNIIPIINENDTVATDEIKFGDNDELSARVSTLLKAKALYLLTDTDGLHSDNPKSNPKARLIHPISSRSEKLMSLVNDIPNTRSRGGMKSKLEAAIHAAKSGVDVTIANGRSPHIIRDILHGKTVGTKITVK